MGNAKIDSNYEGSGLGVTDDLLENPETLVVDPVTKRLLIDIVSNMTPPPTVNPTNKIDQNYEGTAMGVTDDANQNICPITIDPTNGGVLVDLFIEP